MSARCDKAQCFCCICSLRESREFGGSIDSAEPCCQGCHDEMAAPDWPGFRCSDLGGDQ